MVKACKANDAVAGIAGRIQFQQCLRPDITGTCHMFHAQRLSVVWGNYTAGCALPESPLGACQ